MTRCALAKPEGVTAMTRCALHFLRLLLQQLQFGEVRLLIPPFGAPKPHVHPSTVRLLLDPGPKMTETVWARAEMRRVLRAQSVLFRCATARKAASRATARWIPRAQIARLGSTAARERCPARVPLRDGFSVRTPPVSDLLMSLRGRHALLARRCNTFPSVRRARSADANIHSAVHRQNLHLVFSLKHNHYSEPTTRQRRRAPAHQMADAPPCGTRQKQRSKRGIDIN